MSNDFEDDDEWQESAGDWGDMKETSDNEFEEFNVKLPEIGAGMNMSVSEKESNEFQMVKTFVDFISEDKRKRELKEKLNEIVIIRNKVKTPESENRLDTLQNQLKNDSNFKSTLNVLTKTISSAKSNLEKEKDNLQRDISSKKSSIDREIKQYEKMMREKDDEMELLQLKDKRARRSEKESLATDMETIRDEIKTLNEKINSLREKSKTVSNDYEFGSDFTYIDKKQKDIDKKKEILDFMLQLGNDSEVGVGVSISGGGVISLIERKEPLQRELNTLEIQFDQDLARGITNYSLLPQIFKNTIELAKIENLIKDNIEKNLTNIEKLKITRIKIENNRKQIQNVYDTLNHRLTTVKLISASNGKEFRLPPDVASEYKEKIRNLETTISQNRKTIRPFKKIDEETELVQKNMIKDYRDIMEGKVDKELSQRIMASFDVLNNRLQVYSKELARIKRDLAKINTEIEMNRQELERLYSSDDKQCRICANYKFLESCYQCSFEMCTECRGTQSKCPSCSAQFADYKVEQKDKFYEKYGKYGDSIVSAIIMISPEAGNTYGADSSISTMVVEMEKFINAINQKYERIYGQNNKFTSLNDIIAFMQSNPNINLDPMSDVEDNEDDEFKRVAEISRQEEETRYLRQLETQRLFGSGAGAGAGVETKREDKTMMAGLIDEYLPNRVSIEDFTRITDTELRSLYNEAREKKRLIDRLIDLQNIQDSDEVATLKTYEIDELEGLVRSLED